MFEKKVVAITGAGSGIGRALALELGKRGARLAISDISPTTLAKTVSMLGSVEVKSYVLDVSRRDDVFSYAQNVTRDFGEVHFVINNAGTSVLASVVNVTIEEIEKVLSVNLWGVIYGTKAFLPILVEQKSGCVVNISSVFGLVATPCSVAYTISKFGVRGLTETLWQELEGTGVRAVLVHPGGIDTNISKAPPARNERDFERALKEANLRQMTTPPEVCAREIADGLVRGDNRLLVGNGARAISWISRLFPNSYGGIMRKKLGV